MVPLDLLTQYFEYTYTWDVETKTCDLYSKKYKEIDNPYTSEMLNKLVDESPVEEVITNFRNKDNPRRQGLIKTEGKYFEMYYPDDEYARDVAKFLEPHMDKVYMMLTDIYGIQAKVEVHMIHEKDTAGLKEGDVRARENVTFIWLEPDNDDGGNNLSEFVHEINHNFFGQVNNQSTNRMWINEANAKLIPSLYIKHNYDGPVDMWSFYEHENMRGMLHGMFEEDKDIMTLDKANSILGVERAWGRATGEKKIAQRYGLYLWSYVFNNYELDEFKYFLRNLGSGDVVSKMESLLDMSSDEITEELYMDFTGQ